MTQENRACPLMDGEYISEDDCYENCMIAERYIKPDFLPDKAKEKKDFREICLACKYHDLD
jgi:hypothetical protein